MKSCTKVINNLKKTKIPNCLNNKKVILKQISPYRTDFYLSPEGKYKFVTIRYKDVFYKETIHKFVIDENWYHEEKTKKGIQDAS